MKLNNSVAGGRIHYPERIIQFGEGNFLRAFVDWMVDEMNKKADFKSSVVVVQPIEKGMVSVLNEQDGLFTLVQKGLLNGIESKDASLIKSISRGINPYANFEEYLKLAENPEMRFIISNTTEAGIAFSSEDKAEFTPPRTFPGKLTRLLHHRFQTFRGDQSKGFIILPCELIDRNGDELKKAVLKFADLWVLGSEFKDWLLNANVFCNTLVDRIVPGYSSPAAKEIELTSGYEDQLVVECEPFHLWVIEGPQWISKELPAQKAGLNVLFVDSMTPYRTRKVRILNGAHTVITPVAYLCGIRTVRESVENELLGSFLHKTLHGEIIPTLDLPKDELMTFAENVHERFLNPFVNHALISISLNSVSKYKARVLPSLKEYQKRKGNVPMGLSFAMAALIAFYRGNDGKESIPLQDDRNVLDLFSTLWKKYEEKEIFENTLVETFLSDESIWGENLNTISGFAGLVSHFLSDILSRGMKTALTSMLLQSEHHQALKR